MKIIDLLNKIANGEEVPARIKWGCHDFKWFVYQYISVGEFCEPTLLDYLSQCPQMLNDKIITFDKVEEDKKIKKLNNKKVVYDMTLNCEHEIDEQISQEKIVDKINEIIDILNKESKELHYSMDDQVDY